MGPLELAGVREELVNDVNHPHSKYNYSLREMVKPALKQLPTGTAEASCVGDRGRFFN